MTHRWLQFALALFVAIAPTAPTVCLIACATHAADRSQHGQVHSCHEAPTAGDRLVPIPHGCSHDGGTADGSPVSTAPAGSMLPVADLPAQVTTLAVPSGAALHAQSRRAPLRPPDASLIAPLRI